jgi:hypothetical protein
MMMALASLALGPATQARAADGDYSCTMPALDSGATWDRVLFTLACPSFRPTYELRTPVDGLWACSVPDGFVADDERVEAYRCSAEGDAPSYRLRASSAPAISAAPRTFTLMAPATGTTVVSWTTAAPVDITVSRDDDPQTPFASATASGHRGAEIRTPHTYVFRMFAANDHAHVLASTTVRGFERTLSSTSPAVARRPDGKFDVLARGTDGNADLATLAPSGQLLTPWSSLGKQVAGAPSASWSADGTTLDVAAVGADRRVYRRQFTIAGGWTGWTQVPGGLVSGADTVGIARLGSYVSLFARATDGIAYMANLTAAGGVVNPWTTLEKLTAGAPAGSWSEDGRTLMIAAVGADYAVYQRRWTRDGGWEPWVRQTGMSSTSATVGLAARGSSELAMLVRGSDERAWYLPMTAGGSPNSDWTPLGRRHVRGAPVASFSPDGHTLDVAVVGTDDRVYRRRRVDGAWTRWANSQIASTTVGIAGREDIEGLGAVDDLLIRGYDGGAYANMEWATGEVPGPWGPIFKQTGESYAGTWSPDGSSLDTVAIGADREVDRQRFSGGAWHPAGAVPVPHAPASSSAPTMAGTASRLTYAFRGTDGNGYVETVARGGDVVRGWKQLDGPLLGSPALSWSADGTTLVVVAVGTDHAVYHRRFVRHRGWTAWRAVAGGFVAGSPTVGIASFRDDARPHRRVTLFARGVDGDAWSATIAANGRLLRPWASLGKQVLGAPSAIWNASGSKLTVVAVGTDYRAVRRQCVRGSGWRPWTIVPDGGSAPYFALPASTPPQADPALGSEGPPALAVRSLASPDATPPVPSGGLPDQGC